MVSDVTSRVMYRYICTILGNISKAFLSWLFSFVFFVLCVIWFKGFIWRYSTHSPTKHQKRIYIIYKDFNFYDIISLIFWNCIISSKYSTGNNQKLSRKHCSIFNVFVWVIKIFVCSQLWQNQVRIMIWHKTWSN